jgi:hypothetical protein
LPEEDQIQLAESEVMHMTLEEQKRRIENMRREFREAHQELMEAIDRVNKRFEPDHNHPEKTLW